MYIFVEKKLTIINNFIKQKKFFNFRMFMSAKQNRKSDENKERIWDPARVMKRAFLSKHSSTHKTLFGERDLKICHFQHHYHQQQF